MSASRRDFVRNMGFSIAAASVAAESLAAQSMDAQPAGSERLLVDNRFHPTPAPVGVDRLPLSW
ncbi:MAG: hypothetical protein ACT4P7_15190 [Gemmatimonadaceae bacterium]